MLMNSNVWILYTHLCLFYFCTLMPILQLMFSNFCIISFNAYKFLNNAPQILFVTYFKCLLIPFNDLVTRTHNAISFCTVPCNTCAMPRIPSNHSNLLLGHFVIRFHYPCGWTRANCADITVSNKIKCLVTYLHIFAAIRVALWPKKIRAWILIRRFAIMRKSVKGR